MQRYSSKLVIATGFSAMLILLILLVVVWVNSIAGNSERLHAIVNQQKAAELVLTMRDAAHERALILHRMAMISDPFELDELNLELAQRASKFIEARDLMLSMQLKYDQAEVWRRIQPDVVTNANAQNRFAEQLMAGKIADANEQLLDVVIPSQDLVLEELTSSLERSREEVQRELGGIERYNNTAYVLVGALALAAIILGTLTAVSVIRKTGNTEKMLVRAHAAEISANRQKSQFLANMSHEIRTPLTAIIGFAEASLDSSLSASERHNACRTIVNNGKHLLHVINEILDLSKIESQQLSVEQVETDLIALLADVDSVMGMQSRDKGLSFSCEYEYPLPARILTDPTRLKQVLLNLCANAIKFTKQGGVHLQVKCHPDKRELCLSVIDSGIGIPLEQQASLFQPFSQADASTTRRFGGTGLGLYISKQLVGMLGGSISLHSQEGVGTRIDVTVDTGPLGELSVSGPASSAEDGSPDVDKVKPIPKLAGRILLAEDSIDNQRLISLYAGKTGAELDFVDNGRAAVEKALADDYDLVLMDMQMPVMDGLEATTLLRQTGYSGAVVALTANAMKEDRERCAKAGCDAFLSKPIETDVFYATLAQYLPAAAKVQVDSEQQHDSDSDAELNALAADFVAGLPLRIEEMYTSCEREDWETLARVAHKLKGVAGSFGFCHITAQAAVIEEYTKHQQYPLLRGLVAELEASCVQAVRVFELASEKEVRV